MALPAAATQTIVRYQDQVAAVNARVVDFVRRSWGSLDSWRDADIDRFVAAVVPVVAGGQVRVAALTDSYLAAIQTQVVGGGEVVGVPAEAVSTETMRGVPAADVYRRAGGAVWGALSRSEPLQAAVAVGLSRAVVLAVTDLQLARTHAARYVAGQRPIIVAYRRVLSSGACSLCAGATSKFGAHELMPIHGHCSCGSVPIFRGGPDPGEVEEGAPSEVDRGAPIVREHGELGPVLAGAGDDFASL